MSYLEDAVDNALFAEHLVIADEKDANTMGMMKSALAVTAGKGPWGVLLGVWVGCRGGWVWCPGDVLGGWAGRCVGRMGLVSGRCVERLGRVFVGCAWIDFCILDPSVPIYFKIKHIET